MPDHNYYMNLAKAVSDGSKCERAKVGAVIVSPDGVIVSTGFNGQPKGMPNKCEENDTTLPTTLHAELNAILNSIKTLKNATIYVTHFPCNECAKAIVQTGIKKVIFYSDKHKDLDSTKASKIIFENAGVEIVNLKIHRDEIKIQFRD